MEYTVHCLFCDKTWDVTSQDTDWVFVHVYSYCGVCRKMLIDEWEYEMKPKQLPKRIRFESDRDPGDEKG